MDEDLLEDVRRLVRSSGWGEAEIVRLLFHQIRRTRKIPLQLDLDEDPFADAEIVKLIQSDEQSKDERVYLKDHGEIDKYFNSLLQNIDKNNTKLT